MSLFSSVDIIDLTVPTRLIIGYQVLSWFERVKYQPLLNGQREFGLTTWRQLVLRFVSYTVPVVTFPSRRTMILSESKIVLSRWAMVSMVQPVKACLIVFCIRLSVSVSMAAVASSSIRICVGEKSPFYTEAIRIESTELGDVPQPHSGGSRVFSKLHNTRDLQLYVPSEGQLQLWLSVLLKDTSAMTGQAGIRTHILSTPELESKCTRPLGHNTPNYVLRKSYLLLVID